MNWKFTDERPVYQQIVATIRAVILTGELSPGGKTPSVRKLAEECAEKFRISAWNPEKRLSFC